MEGGVRRWLVDISQWDPSPAQFSSILALLPEYEHPAILRFVMLDDRKRALVSRLLQYSLVHEVLDIPHGEIDIKRTIEGKPYLNNSRQHVRYPNFNFSVSHSGNYVGIASEPVCLVGLDIVSDVLRQESSLNFINDFSSYFTHLEWKNIINAGNSNHSLAEFYRYWALKEAYVKALGIGLGYKFDRLEFHHIGWSNISVYVDGEESRDWKFWLFHLDEKHLVSIARGHPGGAAESYKRTLTQAYFTDEEYWSAFALPNPQFVKQKPMSPSQDDTNRYVFILPEVAEAVLQMSASTCSLGCLVNVYMSDRNDCSIFLKWQLWMWSGIVRGGHAVVVNPDSLRAREDETPVVSPIGDCQVPHLHFSNHFLTWKSVLPVKMHP